MNKLFKGLFITAFAVGIVSTSGAAENKIMINYSGQQLYLDKEAKIVNGSVLLPLRALSQEMGYTVNWDQKLKQIEVAEGNIKVNLTIGDKTAYINGEEIKLPVPAQVIDGTTYVPLRFIGDALNIEVSWDSRKHTVNLEGKYTVNKADKKLMVWTKEGRKELADITTLEGTEEDSLEVGCTVTQNGSEIVYVSEIIQGALTGTTSTEFYIKDGKVIDKIERPFHYICEKGIDYLGDEIAFCNGEYLRIYNDRTGELIRKYDLNKFQEGLVLDLMKIGKNYAMGRYENTVHIVDLETGKVTRILDLIPKEDQGYVFQDDLFLATDSVKLVWETDEALVFKYYSITKKEEATVTCKLG